MKAESALESPDPGTLISGERKVLELIATGAPLETILDALCRVIDEQSGLRSSIFLLDSTGERLTLAAGPHLPDVWRTVVASFPITKTACGAAISRREQIVSTDITVDPLYADYQEAADAAGFRGVWSTPFFSKDDRPLGTFAVYSEVPGPPSALNLALVSRATRLASIAVEHHLTEEGLRESEIRFSRAFYANPACMTISSFSDGRFVSVNDAFVRLFGYSRAETLGQTALRLRLWADPGQRPAIMQRLVEGKIRELELKGRTKSGEILDLIVSMEVIELLGQQSVLAIATDITDRKRAEEAVRLSERRWRSVFDNSAIGIVCGDSALRITAANPAVQEISGYSEQELTRLTFLDVTHPDDRHLIEEAAADLLDGRARERQFEKRHLRKNGEIVWVRATMSLMQETNESPRFLALLEDISARKRIDEQLRSSERLLSEAQRVAHIGSWTWDVPNRSVTWSDELYRLFGVQPGDVDPGTEAMGFVHPDDHDVIMTAIQHTFKTKEPYSFFYRIHRRDGEERILHSRGYLVSDQHGDPVSIFGTTQDVTESRRAEETLQTLATRLMQAQDDERRRVAQLLHETTAQDLAGLKMLLARLNRTSDRLSDADRALLAESAQLADRSMTEVRTLAYLLHPPFLDEIGLLSALRWYVKGFADRSGIHVELDLPDALERLPRDVETTLFRVVQEALINVHRHADSPTARIRLQAAADRLAVEIEDRGRGMAPDVVAQLMGGVGALGVGLAGMRERLKQIGGALEIESSDQGTIVRASVPVPEAAS